MNESIHPNSVEVHVTTVARTAGIWEVDIGESPMTQTVVLEARFKNSDWEPINGLRVTGPGPKLGSIKTNACAGGPAYFTGRINFDALRVRCVVYDGHPIDIQIRFSSTTYNRRLTSDTDEYLFVIDEEPTLNDLLDQLR